MVLGVLAAPSRGEDKPKESAPRRLPRRRLLPPRHRADPTNSPTAPDPTGVSYTGADISGKLTKADGKVTLETLART